ncbi:non-hydrolyzing UDP-N-acetylglucosamine 2-epimerase [Salinisphaera aquimarina]|uniref:Non-hydrolyzing UDP-N-acetylglucosamine 2-epimerase n=1 Tax=Salinisphaera aquimarina TaxID=2094031 RepID=A0ABV7ESW2_9GAMM
MNNIRVDLIAAARPNFMKVAPLYHALKAAKWCDVRLIHTGQHYDANMSDSFFEDFSLPAPDIHLEVGSGSHAEQTGKVMAAYERVCLSTPPDWVIVVGDVNSTVACALAAVKLGIRVAHLEAGLRSRDRSMPEEINRLVTDAIVDLLWTPSKDGDENLIAEGVPVDKIDFVGNIMLDAFELVRDKIKTANAAARLGLLVEEFGVVTLHRPSNVDDPDILAILVNQLVAASRHLPLIFAVHPRTRGRLESTGLIARLAAADDIYLIDPLGYIEFMSLVTRARVAITDSGGIQEETTYLGIPCLTLRNNTERPITLTEGTNQLVKPEKLLDALVEALATADAAKPSPELWDGRAAPRIVESLRKHARMDQRVIAEV